MILENDDISADIRAAMAPEEPKDEVVENEPVDEVVEEPETRARDEQGRFKTKEAVEEVVEIPVEQPKQTISPPASYSAAVKAKWAELPQEVQNELAKREADVTRMMTAPDGELRMGRELKEVILPYMPIIQAEGGTPAGAIKDLLNTAYRLRTGSPQQKAALLHEVAQQYGVDLNAYQPQQADPQTAYMQQQLAQIQQQANPEVIKNQLREEMTRDRINTEIAAFASDPKNVYFEQLKPVMGSLMASGQAKDLQDAYDQACYANPTIRSTLLAQKEQEQQAKRRAENEAKRKAGASVNGSPAMASPAPKAPNSSIEDDIRAALREHSGAI